MEEVVLSLRIPSIMKRELDKIAERERRSINGQILWAIENYIASSEEAKHEANSKL